MIIRQLFARTKPASGQQAAEAIQSAVEAALPIAKPHIRRFAKPERASSDHDVRLWHQEVVQRLGRNDFYLVCEPSCDGFAVSMTYENGDLTSVVATDGDIRGQAVTDTLRKIPGVPKRLTGTDLPIHLEVLGNIYVPVLGGVKQPNNNRSGLRLFVHGISSSVGGRVPANQWSALAYLRAVGFDVSSDIKLARTSQEVLSHYQMLANKANVGDYPCRGMLVKVNRFDHQAVLSVHEDSANWALSYGFPPGPRTDLRAIDSPSAQTQPAQPLPARRQPLKGLSVVVEVRSARPSVLQVENRVQNLGGTIVRNVKDNADYIITDNAEKSMLKARLMRARTVGLGDFIRYCNNMQVMSRLDDLIARL